MNLTSKKGQLNVFLRILNPQGGLCNGTCLFFVKITHHLIEGSVVGHEKTDEIFLNSRIDLTAEDHQLVPKAGIRCQFPLRLAFAQKITRVNVRRST